MKLALATSRCFATLLVLSFAACGGSGDEPPPQGPPLVRNDPVRTWTFVTFQPERDEGTIVDAGNQTGGDMQEDFDFGPGIGGFQPLPPPPGSPDPNTRANGQIFSNASGVTYWVLAEAPLSAGGFNDPDAGYSNLQQTQSFIKKADDAKLRVVVSDVFIQALDTNADVIRVCPLPSGLNCDGRMNAYATLTLQAYDGARLFFRRSGGAFLSGWRNHWKLSAREVFGDPNPPLWTARQMVFTDGGTFGEILLASAVAIDIDLTSIPTRGEFTLQVFADAFAQNGRGGETKVVAFLQDPQKISGNAMLEFTGLDPTNRPLAAAPATDPSLPAGCIPGSDAGTLQFLSDAETFSEAVGGSGAQLIVTRLGGKAGTISANVATGGGTAVAGVDYTAIAQTLTFGDGDSAPRIVRVPLLYNPAAEADTTFDVTLSAPTGCGRIGPVATTVVTILDDTQPLPTGPFTLGGTVSGLTGSGLVLASTGLNDLPIAANGAFTFTGALGNAAPYDVRVKTQPTNPNQICTVTRGAGTIANANVSNVAVDCTTPAPSGSLDPAFGSGGKVSSTLLTLANTSTSMALQPDGKIVVVGTLVSRFALARFNSDGSVDTGFGNAGLVTVNFGGRADAALGVTIAPDGKIIAVGSRDASVSAVDRDFAIARLNNDGTPDASFGTAGLVTTDFGASTDQAQAVVVQPDGKIVVAGVAITGVVLGSPENDFALARYNSDGSPDTSFGSGGKVTTSIAGGVDFARNLAVMADGRIVVTGAVGISPSRALDNAGVARYDASGRLDAGFNGSGIVVLSPRGGDALAIESSGSILVSGSAANDFTYTRIAADGLVQTSVATTDFDNTQDTARSMLVQPDGRVVLVGDRFGSDPAQPATFGSDFALARYGTNGQLDPAFGTGGKLVIDFFGSDDTAFSVALQADGKLVVVGTARNGTTRGIGIARVLP